MPSSPSDRTATVRHLISLLAAATVIVLLAVVALNLPGRASLVADELPAAQQQPALESVADRAAYGLGLNIGRQLKADGLDLSPELVARGIIDALKGNKPALNDEQVNEAMLAFQREMSARQEAEMKAMAEKNTRDGAAFLAANKAKEGVVTLPSGLQYKVVKQGTGASPTADDTVRTHYHGTLLDGTVFDSSVERGEPIEFPVGGVIKGWTEALQRMKVGDKWILYVPAELAYGPRSAGPKIGPNSTLIFEVELLDIVK